MTIEGTIRHVFDSINDGDIEGILSVYTNDTVLIFSCQPFVQGLDGNISFIDVNIHLYIIQDHTFIIYFNMLSTTFALLLFHII